MVDWPRRVRKRPGKVGRHLHVIEKPKLCRKGARGPLISRTRCRRSNKSKKPRDAVLLRREILVTNSSIAEGVAMEKISLDIENV